MGFRSVCLGCAIAIFFGLGAGRAPAGTDESRAVTFSTDDRVTIHGEYFAPGGANASAPMALLVHDYQGDRRDWKPLVASLRAAGFAVLAIDLRGHGDSADSATRERLAKRDDELFREMQLDLRAAYDWLAARPGVDRARFCVAGAGLGAGVAIQYAVKDGSVDAIVALSPPTSEFGLDVAGDLGQIRGRRILLIDAESRRAALDKLSSKSEGIDVEAAAGGESGTALLAKESVAKRVAEFARAACGSTSNEVVFGSINSNVYHKAGSGWIARIKPTNLRHYSSPKEAETRGLRAARSTGPDDKPPGTTEGGKGGEQKKPPKRRP